MKEFNLMKSEIKKLEKVAKLIGIEKPLVAGWTTGCGECWYQDYTVEIDDLQTGKVIYIPFVQMLNDKRTSFVPNFIVGKDKKYSHNKKAIVNIND